MTTTESTDLTAFDNSEISLPRSVRFWLLLITDIPSILCTLLLLHHLLRNQRLRNSLSNHTIILLLFFGLTAQLIEMPFYLAFIANSGVVKPSVPVTCLTWWCITFGMYNGGTILMAWTAIERHILIFKFGWVSTRQGRILAHYSPLTILLLYIFIYHIYVLFFFPCENNYVYTLPLCSASPCYQNDLFFGKWDFIMNNILPSLLVALMSITLLIRTVRQKRRLNQQNQWRKQRKMIIQLVSLSVVNIVFNLPLNLLTLAHRLGLSEDYGAEVEHYFFFSCYFLIFLFPFVCLIAYPKLVFKVKRKILCRKVQSNAPIVPSAWVV